MATPKPKKARADTAASTGLALPSALPAAATTPTTTPYQAAVPAIDPNLPAASTPTANRTVQAATGYLNTPGVPATPLATQAYYNYYPPYYSQGYGQGMPYYTAQTAYGTGYGPQAYGALGTPTTATHPYTPTAATPTVAVTASTANVATPTTQRLIPPTAPATSKPSPAAPAAQSLDTASVAQLTDALGSAGVDIRAEEEAMTRDTRAQLSTSIAPSEDRSKKQNFLDPVVLAARVKEITSNHSVTATADAQTYIALALQFRLTTLIKQSIAAVDHRLESQYNRPPPLYPIDDNVMQVEGEDAAKPEPQPMWSVLVRRDVSKQLAALEKIDREEESRVRRRRKERDENEASANGGGAAGEGGGDAMDLDGVGGDGDDDKKGKKLKKKQDGPGVLAKKMTEDMQKSVSNRVANEFTGVKKYSWMQPGAVTATTPVKKPAPIATNTTGGGAATSSSTPTAVGGASAGSSFVRPFLAGGRSAVNETLEERKVTLGDL
ncbi:hypothetical protein FRC01_007726, partial [Tulasnella sp. 417]